MNKGAWRHGFLYERKEAISGHIHHVPKTNVADAPSAFLGCYRDDGLGLCLAASHPFFRAANIDFVHLDNSGQTIPAGPTIARRSQGSHVQAVS